MAGYSSLMDRFGDQRDATAATIGGMQGQVGGMTEFQPWSVRSGLGSTSYADGKLKMSLSPEQQGYADFQGQGAQTMFGRAMQDPTQREGDIYERIRAMQRPGEQRQYDSMNANLFGSGRGGMSTGAYGGSPEQHAFGMAQGEARNAASFGAMDQAQREMQNYAGIGQQMFGNQYQPWQQQQGQAGLGSNQAELSQRGQLEGTNLWSQLGLGGLTAETNYSNIEGNAFGNLITALSSMAGGVGGGIDDAGGLMDFLGSIFGGQQK